eukprot:CAMPEP_0119013776 /NCGR_PEP_ID=MMETSP1176-20130426/8935_1 /TAXON_ID=265551 /ORGANISM="Synedropsis recta cf, Strain CCMP1620" /LENGTH=107 /DNA_ID=CAMNT_0006966893 /DNA_START=38 /DNA_END=358 /DNA_ORIENTATION=+
MSSTKIHSYDSHYPTKAVPMSHQCTVGAVLVDDQDQPTHYTNDNDVPSNTTSSSEQPPRVVAVDGSVGTTKYIHVDSRKSVQLTYCPNCAKENVSTKTNTKPTGLTW